MTMHEMVERIAEVQELERLRAENAALRRRVDALERDERHRQHWDAMRMAMNSRPMYTHEQMRPITDAEVAFRNAQAMSALRRDYPSMFVAFDRRIELVD